MEAPVLQLTVLQGPRTGEILVCKPDSVTNVGRVMRGNHLALRDPGISQKHLCFRFIQDDGFRWCVSDLDTSNGTRLNGLPIAAAVRVSVSDGDVLEIGEKTRLGVKIVAQRGGEEEGDVRGRRVTRRGGSSSRVNTRVNLVRVSGVEEVEVKEEQCKASAPARGRRNNARAAMATIEEKEVLNPDLVLDSVVETGRRGTGRGRKDTVTATDTRVSEELDQNGEVKVGRSTRRGKSTRVLKELDGNCAADSVSGVKAAGAKRKGRGRGKNAVSTVSELEKENDAGSVLKLNIQSSDTETVGKSEPRKGVKARTRGGSSSVVPEEEVEEDAVEEEERKENSEEPKVDFEKMTLGEWFDSMEVFLPKVIRDESERLVTILKEKSVKFAEMTGAGTDSG